MAIACLSGALTALPGCGLELAALASVSKAGSTAFGKSKAKAASEGSGAELYQAAITAQRKLGLEIVKIRVPKPNSYRLTLEDARGADLRVKIDQRTPNLSRITVDFGLFGHDPTGKLFLLEMQNALLDIIEHRPPGAAPRPILIPPHRDAAPVNPDPYALTPQDPNNTYTGPDMFPAGSVSTKPVTPTSRNGATVLGADG